MVALRKIAAEFDQSVTIGIHEDTGQHESDGITNASLGATLHFGAEIDHPGGTDYGYASEADAEKGAVRFLKSGQGYAVLGTTGPHKINIPARPWLDVGVAEGSKEYLKLIADGIESGESVKTILNQVGLVGVGFAQEFMTKLKTPANAPATISRKGSSNPLIDSGAMKQSVNYKVEPKMPDEGLS